jgi:integrase
MSNGNITQRGKSSWRLKFDIEPDPVTGERRTRYKTIKGGKRAAQSELRRLLNEVDEGQFIDPVRTTVSEYLERWDRDWAAVQVSPKTSERYAELMRKHVQPHIGSIAIQKLKPADLAELYAKLLREGRGRDNDGEPQGLAPRTVGHVHRVLHRALGHAQRWQIVSTNVASVVAPPKVESTEVAIWTQEQTADALSKLKDRPIYPIAALAVGTGMRRGEILALRWKDLDLDGAKVRVEQSLEATKAGLRIKAPKTKHSRRAISLSGWTVEVLRAHRVEALKTALALGIGRLPDDGLVFGKPEDGSPRNPGTISTDWTRAVRALDLPPVSFHGLRHTHASQLIAAGLDVLTISRRLGHGSPTVTLSVYGHMFGNTDDRAAQIMDAAFANLAAD